MDSLIPFKCSGFIYSAHAVKRMLEKDIATFAIEQTVLYGNVIKDYKDDKPFPSKLLLNFIDKRPLHVVVAQNDSTGQCIIITLLPTQ